MSVPAKADSAGVRVTAPQASVLLPAFNEEKGLAAMLDRAAALGLDGVEFVVIDDGSTDATGRVAAEAGVRVVRHERRRGKGVAIQTGVAAAVGDRIIVIDSDGSYPIDAVPDIIRLLGDYDMVSGVRLTGRENMPFVNRLGNAAIRFMIRAVSGSRSVDPLTGLYGLRRSALERMRLTSQGFGIEAEITIKAARAGLRTRELPISYGARAGRTKLNPVRDGIVILRTILSLARAERHDEALEASRVE